MNLVHRIETLSRLGDIIKSNPEKLQEAVIRASVQNQWFTKENISLAIDAIANEMLTKEILNAFVARYPFQDSATSKSIALILAGNIPLVGFHDWLMVFLSGNKALIKLSEKDNILLPVLLELLVNEFPEYKEQTCFVEKLQGFDAVIATGGDNSSRYFEYYFSKYPHIIRKNRYSVAILSGEETEEELYQLGIDIFRYFGLGCRNVSRLWVPEGYDFTKLMESLNRFGDMKHHNKYKNNFDYNFTLLLMNSIKHYTNESLLITSDQAYAGRISCVSYQEYKTLEEVQTWLSDNKESLQCIVGKTSSCTVAFGKTQSPALDDFADGVDTFSFLIGL